MPSSSCLDLVISRASIFCRSHEGKKNALSLCFGVMRLNRTDMQTIRTERLLLRPLEITDAARLARITSDRAIAHNLLKTGYPYTVQDARGMILRAKKKGLPVWGIFADSLIGVIGLSGEFGYWLDRHARRQGYAEEAARAVLDYAFGSLGMKSVYASPIADNRRSRAFLEKLGFEAIGRDVAWCKARRSFVPLVRYKLEKNPRSAV